MMGGTFTRPAKNFLFPS